MVPAAAAAAAAKTPLVILVFQPMGVAGCSNACITKVVSSQSQLFGWNFHI